ncbi:TetR/AcrR family transcriptional regulator [Streptomyces albus]|uniref:TetR/AcrR family transcriptional regulator n=1 Tax=Streptomyces sp. NRRL F-5639 TaxID=1463867 RepID=UPI0004C9BACC|nr:TetR/AcrR family transcriptional regulator [Streptomyces sp. NRRL F-5639]
MAKKDQESPGGLPEGVAIAWGLRERPGRGPARGLDVRRIVTAAIAVADAEGLGAVSMSRVATQIGVSTMALYRYVSGKDDLLTLMEDEAVGLPVPGPDPAEGWRAGMEHWARSYADVMARHRWMVRIPISTPPLSPHSVMWMEQALGYLRHTGLDGEEKLGVLITLNGYVRSHSSLVADIAEAGWDSEAEPEKAELRYWQLLSELTRTGDFPAIRELLGSGEVQDTSDGTGDETGTAEFDFGLAVILDGVAALVARRQNRS